MHLGLKTTTHKENHSVANHVRFHASTPLPYLVILPCQYLSQNSWFAEFLVICQPKNNVNGPPGVPLIVINGGTWGRFCWWALMGLHGVNFYPTLRGEMTPLTTGDRAHLVVRLFLSQPWFSRKWVPPKWVSWKNMRVMLHRTMITCQNGYSKSSKHPLTKWF